MEEHQSSRYKNDKISPIPINNVIRQSMRNKGEFNLVAANTQVTSNPSGTYYSKPIVFKRTLTSGGLKVPPFSRYPTQSEINSYYSTKPSGVESRSRTVDVDSYCAGGNGGNISLITRTDTNSNSTPFKEKIICFNRPKKSKIDLMSQLDKGEVINQTGLMNKTFQDTGVGDYDVHEEAKEEESTIYLQLPSHRNISNGESNGLNVTIKSSYSNKKNGTHHMIKKGKLQNFILNTSPDSATITKISISQIKQKAKENAFNALAPVSSLSASYKNINHSKTDNERVFSCFKNVEKKKTKWSSSNKLKEVKKPCSDKFDLSNSKRKKTFYLLKRSKIFDQMKK